MGSLAADHLKMSHDGRTWEVSPLSSYPHIWDSRKAIWHSSLAFPSRLFVFLFHGEKGCFGCEWIADPILKFDLWGSGANGSLRAPVCLFRSSMLAVLMELMVCAGLMVAVQQEWWLMLFQQLLCAQVRSWLRWQWLQNPRAPLAQEGSQRVKWGLELGQTR